MSRHRSTPASVLGGLSLVVVACTPAEPVAPAYPGYGPAPPQSSSWPSPSPPPPLAPAGSPGCGKAAPRTGVQHVSAMGKDRTYVLAVPDGYSAQAPLPLVFVLHGSGGSAQSARTQTDLEKVAGGRAIFVYPDGLSGGWDLDTETSQNRDVGLFDAILLTAHNALCIDSRRVFVTGFSNGAYMANQLGCRRGDRIRGLVTHAGGGPYELHGSYDGNGQLQCPQKAVASLVVHGNSDTTVAPNEGQKSLDHWTYANRCGGGTAPAWLPPCVAEQGCFQPVGVCRIPGLGHGLWAQAGKVTWMFFDALR